MGITLCELQRIKIGSEVASDPISPDHHQGTKRILRSPQGRGSRHVRAKMMRPGLNSILQVLLRRAPVAIKRSDEITICDERVQCLPPRTDRELRA